MRKKFLQIGFENSIRIKIVTYAVLIGTSPMIPVIFVDEMMAGFWWRRLVKDLAQSYNVQLTNAQIFQLSRQNGLGCSTGCSSILLYPIKEFIREILFWLEVRRGVDLATRAYYSGILLNALFQMDGFNPEQSPQYSAAITYAIKGINLNIVMKVFENSLNTSKGRARELRAQIKALRKRMRLRKREAHNESLSNRWAKTSKPSQTGHKTDSRKIKVDQQDQDEGRKTEPSNRGLVGRIAEGLSSLPAAHFDHLRNRLTEGLIIQDLVDASNDIQV